MNSSCRYLYLLLTVIVMGLSGSIISQYASAQVRPDLIWMAGGDYNPIASVAYSPDGKLIASCTSIEGNTAQNTNFVKLWRASDGALLRTIYHASSLFSVAFSPDGKLFAAGSNAGVILVWKVADGTLVYTLTGFTGAVNSIAFSPNGSLLAGGSVDQTVRIWNVADGSPAITLTGHTAAVLWVAFSPDGKTFASGATQNGATDINLSLIVRRTSNWSRIFTDGYGANTAAFSPDSQTLALMAGAGVYFVRVSDDTRLGLIPARCHSVKYSPDGKSIALDNSSIINNQIVYSILIYDPASQTLIHTLTGVTGQINSLAYSPDGQSLVSGSSDHTIRTWHTADGSSDRVLEQQRQYIIGMAVSPDGKLVVSGNDTPGQVFVRRVSDGSVLKILDVAQAHSIAFSPDGKYLAVHNANHGGIDIWNVKDWSLYTTLAVSSQEAFYVTLALAFSPNGQYLAAGRSDPFIQGGELKLWRLPDFTACTLQGDVPTTAVLAVAFSSDGKTFASGGVDKTVRLWDASTCKMIRALPVFNGSVSAVTFSPDGQQLAVGTYGDISLWNVAGGNQVLSWPSLGGTRSPVSLAFSPDGQVLLSGRESDTLNYWQVSDGSLLHQDNLETFFWAGWQQNPILYTPDGSRVLYGRLDGTVCCALNPYRNAVFPTRGGNTGNVTVKIVTALNFPLVDGATVKLTADNQRDIVAANTTVENNYIMTALFALNGAPLGLRNVVITNPDGTTRIYPQGFTIEQGGSILPSISIIGRSVIRSGALSVRTVIYGNTSNIDAHDMFLKLEFPNEVSYSLDWLGPRPEDVGILWDYPLDWLQVPVCFAKDSESIVPGWILTLPASSVNTLAVTTSSQQPPHTHLEVMRTEFSTLPASAFSQRGNAEQVNSSPVAQQVIGAMTTDDPTTQQLQQKLINVTKGANNLVNGRVSGWLIGQLMGLLSDAIGRPVTWIYTELQTALRAATLGIDEIQRGNTGINRANAVDEAEYVTPGDPNDLAGTVGYGDSHWISRQIPLFYSIYFENLPTVTAPVAEMVVTDHLDATKLDMTTANLQSVTFANQTVTATLETSPPVGQRQFNADVDLRPSKNLIVHINTVIDMLTGDLTWHFTSLDPDTGLPLAPDDPNGFLDPGQEGSALFSVTTKQGLPTGTVVTNQATIVFVPNGPMDTPQWFNTIDNDKPVSAVSMLPAKIHALSFPVSWSGGDIGSGLRDYTIYVSDNGGPFTPWLTNTTDTHATYTGASGHTYAFYSAARDNVYNIEDAHAMPDATTTTPNITDVSSLMQVNSSGLVYNRDTKLFTGTITLKNVSKQTINGPLEAVLNNLTSGVTLTNAAGTTNEVPYLKANVAALAPGGTVTLTVQFSNPSNAKVGYSVTTYSGSF